MAPKAAAPPKLGDDTALAFRQDNPKRSGTKAHERYEQYKAAKTVAEALRLGAVRPDITNDIKMGFCSVADGASAPGGAAAPAAAAGAASPSAAAPGRAAAGGGGAGAGRKRAAPAGAGAKAAKGVADNDAGDAPAAAPPAAAASSPPPAAKRPRSEAAPIPAAAAPAAAAASASVPSAAAAAAAEPAATAVSQARPEGPLPPSDASSPSAATTPSTSASTSASTSTSASSSSVPVGRLPNLGSEVDLSFAKLEGKPLKFVRRTMGEAKRLLCPQGLEEAKKSGYAFSLLDRDNLAKWAIRLSDLNADGKLAKDLASYKLDLSIDLEISLPDGFPLEPPFVRVVYPQLKGGYVFSRGGICFEPLTAKGWAPSMTLPSLAIAIKGILDYGDVRVAGAGDREKRTVPQYTEEGARKDHSHIVAAHRGGEGNTYGSLKHYSS